MWTRPCGSNIRNDIRMIPKISCGAAAAKDDPATPINKGVKKASALLITSTNNTPKIVPTVDPIPPIIIIPKYITHSFLSIFFYS